MTPDDPRHGTEAGHEQHNRDNEQPCHACYDAKLRAARRRTKRKTMGHKYQVPIGTETQTKLNALRERGATHEDIANWCGLSASQVWRILTQPPTAPIYTRTNQALTNMRVPDRIVTTIGITRRLQALQWLGYSAIAISDATGVHVDTIRDATEQPREFMAARVRESIVTTYDRLSMRVPTGPTQQHRAGITRTRGTARRNGWYPPLAWDDIDHPKSKPYRNTLADDHRTRDDIDPVVVDRFLSGENLSTTPAERREILRRWVASGRSARSLCNRTGWKEGRYTNREDDVA